MFEHRKLFQKTMNSVLLLDKTNRILNILTLGNNGFRLLRNGQAFGLIEIIRRLRTELECIITRFQQIRDIIIAHQCNCLQSLNIRRFVNIITGYVREDII